MNKLSSALLIAVFLAAGSNAAEVLYSAKHVTQATACVSSNCTFNLCGRVVYIRDDMNSGRRIFVVEDASGAAIVMSDKDDEQAKQISPGDAARFEGGFKVNAYGKSLAIISKCDLVSRGKPPPPTDATITELLDGKLDFKLVRISGILRDATFSETFPGWIILVLCGQKERIFVSVQGNVGTLERFRGLVGAKVSAVGVCTPSDPSARMKVGRTFKVASAEDVVEMGFVGTVPTQPLFYDQFFLLSLLGVLEFWGFGEQDYGCQHQLGPRSIWRCSSK